MLTPNEAYQYDPTFRRVVDLLCAYLSEYQITPSELRQAAILAATMHESRCIKPLFIKKPKQDEALQIFMDEAKAIPTAMFGAISDAVLRTATGAMLGSRSGRYPSDGSTVTQVDKSGFKCICLYTGTNKDLHMQTCKDYNWGYYHPKPEHCHTFSASGNGYDVCMDCGMSDVYYNWSTKK